MATAKDGGYDCNFVDELPEDLICVVCSFALKEPIQLEVCGHRLCKYCFNQLLDHAQNRFFLDFYLFFSLNLPSESSFNNVFPRNF